MIQRHLFISGRVQGVSYRKSAVTEAVRMAAQGQVIRGWIRNLSDGRVEAVIQGEEPAVAAFIQWCKHGPRLAVVESVDIQDDPVDSTLGTFFSAQSL